MDGRRVDSARIAVQAVVAESAVASSSSSRSKILLPIDTLRNSTLQTGDAVAISCPDVEHVVVGTVWPSVAVASGTVRLPLSAQLSLLLPAGQTVTITPFGAHGASSSRSLPTARVLRVSLLGTKPEATSEFDQQMLAVYLKQVLVDLACIQIGQQLSLDFQGTLYRCRINSCMDGQNGEGCEQTLSTSQTIRVCLVARNTEVNVATESEAAESHPRTQVRLQQTDPYAQLGGLDRQIQEIRALIEMPLMRPELFHEYGLRPPKGVLLYGPPGTGKTSLARAVAAATGSSFLTINGPELSSAFHGETESKLRRIFREARAKSPCIVIIDEIDALAPRREGGSGDGGNVDGAGEVERRVVAQLLTLLDGIDEDSDEAAEMQDTDSPNGNSAEYDVRKSTSRVVVLAATNRPNAIDPALRRPGRIDREIEIGIPSASARGAIIRTMIRPVPNSLTATEIDNLAGRTHGYVGADLSALVREAGMRVVRHVFDRESSVEGRMGGMDLSDRVDRDRVSYADFVAALAVVRPSAMREVFLEPPKVYWSDIAGSSTPSIGGGGALSAKSVQSQVRELVEWPIKHAASFQRLGISPPRGVLLYGPPGCSKTLIARALATESGLNFLAVKGPELYSKYVGESERAVREIFKKARAAAPSILFFDEIDAVSTSREGEGDALNNRIIASLLNEMDGIESLADVVIVGATNRPQALDPALLRPGRLDRLVYVGPPDQAARREIMRKRMSQMAIRPDEIDLDRLAAMTHGCSGAEVVSVCQEAGLLAMDEDLTCAAIEQRHFEAAASSVKRRITAHMVQQYETWRDTLVV